MKILMVCLGNICRSPMAEGIMRDKLQKAGIDADIDSAGTGNYHIGEHPDHRAVRCLKSRGVDISKLCARQFIQNDFGAFDYIFTMDDSNHRNVLAMAKSDADRSKVKMFMDVLYPGKKISVPDPWFGDEDGFSNVAEMLERAAEEFVVTIRKQ